MTKKFPLATLLLSNLIPLFGALFFGWNLSLMLFIYWFENVVIGIYVILKMLVSQKENQQGVQYTNNLFGKTTHGVNKSKSATIVFFTIHYGIFTISHGVFLFTSLATLPSLVNTGLLLACVTLFVTHGISFVENYLGSGEYKRLSPEDLMFSPYKRIIVMHLTVIFGSMFVLNVQGTNVWALVALALFKTLADASAHLYEHKVKLNS